MVKHLVSQVKLQIRCQILHRPIFAFQNESLTTFASHYVNIDIYIYICVYCKRGREMDTYTKSKLISINILKVLLTKTLGCIKVRFVWNLSFSHVF